ncbi:hypothetical protein MCOR02_005864 [Pyricularia oryzae]|uniref:Uncharacterized protein n=1 Tax=Pyricularia oryzae TaxID=318829 RepID=A0A4P7NKU1_PYROR|nr:hypothetical protein MCOR02_005864 [Pyricularia oryzae]KAI6374937.1 hypothetical protein MCOR31_002527 [Pyricularia oryzae]KAI6414102.1 hypothetical protein MCOR20_002324 [Pyricularia oryzae]KAI6435524.1 hypothetical protein MCOR24_000670 [Pyricularia oryzae]KAI6511803.1 hypothetical protein MCOR13_000367 [Pyricularia oryzae]
MADFMVLSLVATCLQIVTRIFSTLETAYDLSQEFKNVPEAIRNLVLDVKAAEGYLQIIHLREESNGLAGNGGNQALVDNIQGAHRCLKIVYDFATKHASSIQSYKFCRRLVYMIQRAEIMEHRDQLRNRLIYLRLLQDSRPNKLKSEDSSIKQTSSDPGPVSPQAGIIVNDTLSGGRPVPNHPILAMLSRWRSRNPSRRLVQESRRGDPEESQRLIDAGADVNYQSRAAEPMFDGKTALHEAAEMGHTSQVRFLLRRGANPKLRTTGPSNTTALHLAVINNHLAVIQQLLNTNAVDVDAKDGEGFSPLQRCRDPAAMIALLRAGADPNCRLAGSSETVLHWAAGMGHFALVEKVAAMEDTAGN